MAPRRDRGRRERPRGHRWGTRRADESRRRGGDPRARRANGGCVMTDGPGIVYLVGAGPGDPGLMTARALELIVAADVIVHDRMIPRDALAAARPDAEILYVGKEPGAASVPQEGIEEVLVDRARQGKLVVRVEGGGPFLF